MSISEIRISNDETHHIINGKPLYERRFKSVMSFHEPGLAPVVDESGAYHIGTNGYQAYEERFKTTYGFYCGLAAAEDETGWFHITPEGKAAYDTRYDWVGNFQEKLCTVRDNDGSYHHIELDGSKAYEERYRYAGDYKNGVAVVYDDEGLAHHIDGNGKVIHRRKFLELGVFHKVYAIARDEDGYFHIDKEGNTIYSNRFEWVEPFYNGRAFVKNQKGELCVIDEKGKIIHKASSLDSQVLTRQFRNQLMDMMVGYWNTQILYCIVRSDILDEIDSGAKNVLRLSNILELPTRSIEMLIDACIIWNLVSKEDITITPKGSMLLKKGPLHNAALMWGEEHYQVMGRLWDSLKTQEPQFENLFDKPLFEYFSSKENSIYHKALEEYTLDYTDIVDELPFDDIGSIVDVGGATGKLLDKIVDRFRNIKKAFLFDLPGVHLDNATSERITPISGDFFFDPLPKSDSAILSRILHDWPDNKCKIILDSINRALPIKGKIVIIEMVVPDSLEKDVGVRLNFNLLVSVGGKERKKSEFRSLLTNSGFGNIQIIETDNIVSVIIAEKERDIP